MLLKTKKNESHKDRHKEKDRSKLSLGSGSMAIYILPGSKCGKEFSINRSSFAKSQHIVNIKNL